MDIRSLSSVCVDVVGQVPYVSLSINVTPPAALSNLMEALPEPLALHAANLYLVPLVNDGADTKLNACSPSETTMALSVVAPLAIKSTVVSESPEPLS